MAYPSTIPTTPQGYCIGENVRGHFAGFYNSAHYAFVLQAGFDSPSGDLAIHAMKSTDAGNTWTEQDYVHAPTANRTPPGASSPLLAYTVSAPDGNTIHFVIASAATDGSGSVDGFYLTTYDLATDTWGSVIGKYTYPALNFWSGSLSAPGIIFLDFVVRGTGDYLFAFNGPWETVGAQQYGRVYVCNFDGTTFFAPAMLPGQYTTPYIYTATRSVVDSSGITHFVMISNGGFGTANPAGSVQHIAMHPGPVGTDSFV